MNISGIVIEIEGKKYAIEMAQAKALHAELDNLFGTPVQYVPWIQPWYQEPLRPYWETDPGIYKVPDYHPGYGDGMPFTTAGDSVMTSTAAAPTWFSLNSMELENE